MKSTLIHVELYAPTPIDPPAFEARTWILQSIAGFKDQRSLAFGGVGTSKHKNMGRIGEDLRPRQDGTFMVELGAVLNDRLPAPGEQQEYVLSVPGEGSSDVKDLCFSNQMLRVRFLRKSEPHHLLCPLYRLTEVQAGKTAAPVDAPFEYLSTVVTTRYMIAGTDAEDALSTYLEPSVYDFVARINRVVAAHLLVAPEQSGLLTPAYDYGSFDYMYLFTSGVDPRNVRTERLGLSLFRNTLVTGSYDEPQAEALRAYVAGSREPDDIARLLRSARGYIDGGVLHLALLQLAIAAELATTQYVHREYLRRGVSKTKLDDRKAEITFSIMLNIEVPALAPEAMKPDRQLLGRVDRVRTLRNELMHYGRFKTSQQELRELYAATKELTAFLTTITKVGEES